jgi:glycine cleavage system T protein
LKTDFTFNESSQDAAGSVLHEAHLTRVPASRLAPFAGTLMPLWFSSIQEEHLAVRTTAGLFDCTHMGVLSITGEAAQGFINTVATNQVATLANGQAQYAYLLNANGAILDDIILYKRTDTDFLMVVNAGNASKIKAWFKGLLADEFIIDPANPERGLAYKPVIEDLNRTSANGLVDIALQGPASMDLVAQLFDGAPEPLRALKPFRFMEGSLQGIECVMARTGYTGAAMAFELLVPPANASELWTLLLEKGEPLGILPCGLGARDSLRIQAGLPLYGHELAGDYHITPFEAGYGWAVKLDKDFFIGQAAMQQHKSPTQSVVRVGLPGGRGVRPVREHDPILDAQGRCQGWILSSAAAADQQIALAYVDHGITEPDTPVGVYYAARSSGQVRKGRLDKVTKQNTLEPDIKGQIIARFENF